MREGRQDLLRRRAETLRREAARERGLHDGADLVAVERLRDVVERVVAQALDRRVERAVAGDDEGLDLGVDLLDPLERGDAAEPRHAEVERHEVDRLAAEDRERIVTRRRGEDVTILAEDGAEGFSDTELVVDDQHAWPLDHGDG